MNFFEVNFNGLPAPYHNYGGLSDGNIASTDNRGQISRPREAALQALAKAATAMRLGLVEAILPPQLRPDFTILKNHGFTGSESQMLRECINSDPVLFKQIFSSSSMWTANAATIAPSIDTSNHQLNIASANLAYNHHRMIEEPQTSASLKKIFKGDCLNVLDKIEPHRDYGDEGAANHIRLAPTHGDKGLHIFVYGNHPTDGPKKFPARQSLSASQAVARKLQIPTEQCLFLRQNPVAIDAGVFHNDVISVGNQNVFLYHAETFADPDAIQKISTAYTKLHPSQNLILIKIDEITLDDIVRTYFFNSQVVTTPTGDMAIIAPIEVSNHPQANALVQKIIAANSNPITSVDYQDLSQSMRNGGGPACLRLRVVMNHEQKAVIEKNANVFLNPALIEKLEACVTNFYRPELKFEDLADIELYRETEAAVKEFHTIMRLS